MLADLNWSISPSDFMNWAAFLTNFGLVSISSQLIHDEGFIGKLARKV